MLKKIVAGMLLASALPTMACATDYSFVFTGFGTSITGSGTLTTANTLNTKGGYDITGISGTFGGNTITGLVPNPNQPEFTQIDFFGVYDNILFPNAPIKFDDFGVAFTAGSSIYNIFNAILEYQNNVDNEGNPVGAPPPKDYGLIVNDLNPVEPTDPTYGDFTLTAAAVPEASTWAMIIVGFGMMGGSIRYSRKARSVAA